MTFAIETVFFDIKRSNNTAFAEIRSRANGGLLTQEQIAEIEGIPDGFAIAPHPDKEGRGALTSDKYSGVWMANHLGQVGFRYNEEDAAVHEKRENEPNTTEEPEENSYEIIRRFPGGAVVAVWPINPPQPPEPTKLDDFEKVAFRFGRRPNDDGKDTLYVALAGYMDNEWTDIDHYEVEGIPSFVKYEQDRLSEVLVSEDEARRRLSELGWQEKNDLFLWYTPQELSFGVEDFFDMEDGPSIILMPIAEKTIYAGQEHLPYDDDLREDGLYQVPELFDDNLMENTWNIKAGWTRDDVISHMTALGYTHDPELEDQ